jgi:Sulfotransferase family
MNDRLPNFLIIGAAKSATTSLYFYLRQHPEVFMPPNKEPHYFFAPDLDRFQFDRMRLTPITTLEAYQALFEGSEKFTVRGEASTRYLPSAYAPSAIRKAVPHVKLIAVLRNPMKRAYSHYLMMKRNRATQHDTFQQVIDEEIQASIKAQHWDDPALVPTGFYFPP